MRRFDFRLEKLLRLRNHLEKLQQLETHENEHRVVSLIEAETMLSEQRQATSASLAPVRGARWKGQEQKEKIDYLVDLEAKSVGTQQSRVEAEEKLVQSREQLVERARNRKVVESLRTREFDRWRDSATREENGELDEIGQRMHHRERGAAMLTVLLLVFAIGLGFLCFSTWNNWLGSGDVGYPIIRAPFDRMAQERVEKDLLTFQNDQRVRRQKIDRNILESRGDESEIIVEGREREGFKRTLERIRQKEEDLRKKEDDLKSRQAAIEQSQRELTAEIRRNNNLLNRISSTLGELQTLEEIRTKEISEDRAERIDELAEMVRRQKPADAATLLLAVAYPDPLNPLAPPFPPEESFEGPDLVLEVLQKVPSVDRAEIMNKMVRESADKSAILFDMMDNPRTGLEPETTTAKP